MSKYLGAVALRGCPHLLKIRSQLIALIMVFLFCTFNLAVVHQHQLLQLQPAYHHEEVGLTHTTNQTVSLLPQKKATLCTVIKDPHKRYIDEWADYHMALGFTGLRLYDNTDEFVLKDWGTNKTYAAQIDRIHFIPDVTHNITRFEGVKSEVQSEAFMDCIRNAIENDANWVAGFDLDEFLVLRNSTSITTFMDQYCKYPCDQISFNWLMFGPSNRTKYKPVPVTKRFQIRIPHGDENLVKGIVNPKAVDSTSFWVHTFPMKAPYLWLDTTGKSIKAQNWQRWLRLANPNNPQDVAVIHHYKTLSEEEWHDKNCVRQDVNNLPMPCDEKTAAQTLATFNVKGYREIYDDTAWLILKMLLPEYAIYDRLDIEELG